MNRKQSIVLWVGLTVILLMAVIFAVTVWPTKYRYLPTKRPYFALRINRFTGEVKEVKIGPKVRSFDEIIGEKPAPLKLPLKLLPEEVKKIDTTYSVTPVEPLGVESISEYFKVSLYNGSYYDLEEATITITAKEKNGDIRWSRQFRRGIDIVSNRSGHFSIEIPKVDGAELFWTIDEFRGTPIIK
ncbi:MAG: hypothetical protein FVQ80_03240 [Planctomycetes bacterium]|nr:hypothetical protein [Planctomycetota bacterium]